MNDSTMIKVDQARAEELLASLPGGWALEEGHLAKVFDFANFVGGLDFVNRVGEIAEAINHHPDVYLSFKQVRLDIYSHKLGGLCQADFELAREIERLPPR